MIDPNYLLERQLTNAVRERLARQLVGRCPEHTEELIHLLTVHRRADPYNRELAWEHTLALLCRQRGHT